MESISRLHMSIPPEKWNEDKYQTGLFLDIMSILLLKWK